MPATPQRLAKRDETDLVKITEAQAELDDLTARRDKLTAELKTLRTKIVKTRERRDTAVFGLLGRGIRPFTIAAHSGIRESRVSDMSAAMSRAGSRPAPRR